MFSSMSEKRKVEFDFKKSYEDFFIASEYVFKKDLLNTIEKISVDLEKWKKEVTEYIKKMEQNISTLKEIHSFNVNKESEIFMDIGDYKITIFIK